MRVIKFKLNEGINTIPSNHVLEPKWIEWQGDSFQVWCQEFTQLPTKHPLEVYLAVTGETVPPDYPNYIGTATTPERTFVVHLFK